MRLRKFVWRSIRKIIALKQEVKVKLNDRLLNARIKTKFFLDKLYLPLKPEHYELYQIIHKYYWNQLNDFPDLINCRDFNDKIQWLKLFDQSHKIVQCSDKLLVRDHISKRVGQNYLVKLYQIHDHFSEIDFDSLPSSFVIKTNHDSGTVIVVKDKSKLDLSATETRIEASLKRYYGWEKGEWSYSYIKPKVFVEQLIEPETSKQLSCCAFKL